MIVILDYEVGNVKSVWNALNRIGMEAVISNQIDTIEKASGIILPGVGSFSSAMKQIKKRNLQEVLTKQKQAGVPILGICLGMQILYEKGFETEEQEGLGFLAGEVRRIKTNQKLPHMGWNQLYRNQENDIMKYVKEGEDVYFVHSYMADFIQEEVIGYTIYGETKIPAIVGKENVLGCQFHPEKSGEVGKRILQAWKERIR